MIRFIISSGSFYPAVLRSSCLGPRGRENCMTRQGACADLGNVSEYFSLEIQFTPRAEFIQISQMFFK